jgi:cysteine-rich repeat protein
MCHKLAVCGNGTIEGTEQCDDGNLRNLDGCDKNCKYEVVGRMTNIAIQGTAAPTGCTPTTNALGTRAVTNTALGTLNNSLTTGITDGTTNVMTYFEGLDDLTGVSDPNGLQIGVVAGTLDPAKGAWPMNNPIDWWFYAAGSNISMGLPTGVLTNGTLAARALQAGPSDVSLTLLLAGSPALLEMLKARIWATLNGTPAPNAPAPPPAQLASGLTVFQTFTGSGANQGLCGNITVESLAQIPVPQSLAVNGTNACGTGGFCGSGAKKYTYCGMGMPVSSSCNSLLDVLVGGCQVAGCLVTAINPTQPDVPFNGTITTLSLGTNNKVPTNVTTGDKDAYSSYLKFDGNRSHFTTQTCTMTSDCQTALTCQSNGQTPATNICK